jgi:neutral ceramidase
MNHREMSMSRFALRTAVLTAACLVFSGSIVVAADWKAGVGKAAITPKESMWMAGYGARDHPSEGAVHDLWAKALGLEDPTGKKVLIISLDVCGIDGALSNRIRDALKAAHGLDRDRIVLACSHTHCGPVVGTNLLTMYTLDDVQKQRVVDYTKAFEQNILKAAAAALAQLEPAEIAWESGRADFAVNRRANKEPEVPELREKNALLGPVDQNVPVLRVRSQGKVKAILCGYACHCTVLGFYKFCGDYAGFAQIELESRYPGAQAMFFAGCGADQNPLPRKTIELAEKYGWMLADAVRRVVDSPMRVVETGLSTAYEEIPLRLGTLPTREQVENDLKSTNGYIVRRAQKLLRAIERDGKLAETYPYPVEVWRLGELTWVILGGEVVVDYSLRLKRNLGSSDTWIAGYCNDVMAYIPSLRVLKEGGYEGETAMIYYGLPTKWSEQVEDQIIEAVTRLEKKTRN